MSSHLDERKKNTNLDSGPPFFELRSKHAAGGGERLFHTGFSGRQVHF